MTTAVSPTLWARPAAGRGAKTGAAPAARGRAPLASPDDAALVARAAGGDERALEALYDRYGRIVYSFALRLVWDPELAEEVAQEVFFRLWQGAGGFDPGRGTVPSWLLSITHNLSIDEVRKRRRRPQREAGADPEAVFALLTDGAPEVEEAAWLGALRERVAAALGRLPPAQRQAIELAYYRGLTQREISGLLGVPLGTVKTRTRLALAKLRETLGDVAG